MPSYKGIARQFKQIELAQEAILQREKKRGHVVEEMTQLEENVATPNPQQQPQDLDIEPHVEQHDNQDEHVPGNQEDKDQLIPPHINKSLEIYSADSIILLEISARYETPTGLRALLTLSKLHFYGCGVPKNDEKAANYFRKFLRLAHQFNQRKQQLIPFERKALDESINNVNSNDTYREQMRKQLAANYFDPRQMSGYSSTQTLLGWTRKSRTVTRRTVDLAFEFVHGMSVSKHTPYAHPAFKSIEWILYPTAFLHLSEFIYERRKNKGEPLTKEWLKAFYIDSDYFIQDANHLIWFTSGVMLFVSHFVPVSGWFTALPTIIGYFADIICDIMTYRREGLRKKATLDLLLENQTMLKEDRKSHLLHLYKLRDKICEQEAFNFDAANPEDFLYPDDPYQNDDPLFKLKKEYFQTEIRMAEIDKEIEGQKKSIANCEKEIKGHNLHAALDVSEKSILFVAKFVVLIMPLVVIIQPEVLTAMIAVVFAVTILMLMYKMGQALYKQYQAYKGHDPESSKNLCNEFFPPGPQADVASEEKVDSFSDDNQSPDSLSSLSLTPESTEN